MSSLHWDTPITVRLSEQDTKTSNKRTTYNIMCFFPVFIFVSFLFTQ